MDKPISVGDLVVVLHGCECDPQRGAGVVFRVEKFGKAYSFGCRHCGHDMSDGRLLAYGRTSERKGYVTAAWCKRIPPLDELEGQRSEDEMDIFDFLDV